jgi:hypothetical protein
MTKRKNQVRQAIQSYTIRLEIRSLPVKWIYNTREISSKGNFIDLVAYLVNQKKNVLGNTQNTQV